MTRSIWKIPFIANSFFKPKNFYKKTFKIWSRRSVIPCFLLNSSVLVHTGQTFKKFNITRECVGFKFGDFVNTRKFTLKGKKTKKNKKK